MEESSETAIIPDWLRSALSLLLTLAAAALYAYILGLAELRTYVEGAPVFDENMVHAAGLLSGLVGAVVAAGFAQGRAPSANPASPAHATGGVVRTGWVRIQQPSLAKVKFLGLARVLGFRAGPRLSMRTAEPAPSARTTLVMIVGVLYFLVYLLVGAAALALTITRPVVPELIANAGWVWLGTVLSAGYTFFALGSAQ